MKSEKRKEQSLRLFLSHIGLAFLDHRSVFLLVLLAAILLAFGITTPRFLTYPMFRVITSQSAEIGLMGLGMGLAWMVNGVDLSVNDAANLSALTAALLLKHFSAEGSSRTGWLLLSYLIALITGLLCGLLNGILIGYLDIPPILATLGTMTVFRGVSVAVTRGSAVAGLPAVIAVIGRGVVFNIPIPFLIFLGIYAVIFSLLNYTAFGFKVRMVGINPKAAYFSGINYRRVIVWVYVISGFLSSIAGIIIMGRTRSVAYEYGTQVYIVFALLITNLAGVTAGYYGVTAAALATLTLQVLSTGFYTHFMTLQGGPFFNNFLWGLFLVTVLVFAQVLKRLKEKAR